MNEAAILGLLGSLYAQVAMLTAENHELTEQLAAQQADAPPSA